MLYNISYYTDINKIILERLTKPVFPFFLVLESVRHFVKEISHHFLFSLACGIDQEESQYVCLQPVHCGQGIVRQATEEALVQIHPEGLQVGKVGTLNTLHNMFHNAVHL